MAKISIIIPVYNVEKYIKKALDSIINQTLPDLEIICINDYTPDNSFSIVHEYASKDSRFVLLEQKTNQGPGNARNQALDIASGEYIMFLDPDDWLELDACELAYNQISKNQNDVVFFKFFIEHFNNTKKEIELISSLVIDNDIISNSFAARHNLSWDLLKNNKNIYITMACAWGAIYNKQYISSINARFSETRNCEDNPFFFNVLANATSFSFLSHGLYHYRQQINNIIPYYAKNYNDVLYNKNEAYKIIVNSCNHSLLDIFVPYYWETINVHMENAKKADKKSFKIIFKDLNKLAKKLDKNHTMSLYKEKINYPRFKRYFRTTNLFQFYFLCFLKNLISIEKQYSHYVISILFIKISIHKD